MKKEEIISPFVLFVTALVLVTIWISIFLHATLQHPHLHLIEKLMFSAYFTIIGCIAMAMGFGAVALVFSCVLWIVQKLTGVEEKESDDQSE